MKKIGYILYFWFSISLTYAEEITVVTEEWPPYNYEENNKITGVSTEVVRASLELAKVQANFEIIPWARAYDKVLNDKNVLIYTIARTVKREKLFKWIGPLFPRRIYLYKLKSRPDVVVNSLEDMKKYTTGVMNEDAMHHFLLNKEFQNIKHFETVPSEAHNYRKLFKGRIELITANDIALPFQMKKYGFQYSQIEKAFLLIEEGGYYMAFSKSTPDDLVKRVQNGFNQIKKKGKIDAIVEKYLK